MKPPLSSRKPAALSHSVQHQLNLYAIAAAGVAAVASPAEAKIIYTPAHHVILRRSRFALDLNHDGKTDFFINHRSGCTTDGACSAGLYAMGALYKGNYVVGNRRTFDFAYALKAGSPIGPRRPFLGFAMYYRFHGTNTQGKCMGDWSKVKDRYLGFKFLIKGKTHFGWARLNVTCSPTAKQIGTLTGYAYETNPGKAILAGASEGPDDAEPTASLNNGTPGPATLGTLALGTPGLSIWRREESVFAVPRPE